MIAYINKRDFGPLLVCHRSYSVNAPSVTLIDVSLVVVWSVPILPKSDMRLVILVVEALVKDADYIHSVVYSVRDAASLVHSRQRSDCAAVFFHLTLSCCLSFCRRSYGWPVFPMR